MPKIPTIEGSGVSAGGGTPQLPTISPVTSISVPELPMVRGIQLRNPVYRSMDVPRYMSNFVKSFTELGTTLGAAGIQKAKEKRAFEESMWVEQTYSRAERDWLQTMEVVGRNPSDGVTGETMALYDEFKASVLENAPSDQAKLAIERSLNNLGVKLLDTSLRIESNYMVQQNVRDLNQLVQDAVDSISISKDPDVLFSRQKRLTDAVDFAEKSGRIPVEVADKFRDSINGLGAAAAEAIAPDNPTLAKNVLDATRGISIERRTAVENKIRASFESGENLFKHEQRTLLDSHLAQLEETGTGNSNFSIGVFESVMGKDAAQAARDQEEVAKSLYVGKSAMQAKSLSDIAGVLSKAKPEANDPKYGLKSRAYVELARYADEQKKLMESDPFSYSLQDPAVRSSFAEYLRMAETGDQGLTTSAMHVVMRQSLAIQESLGIPRDERSVLTNDEKLRLAGELNGSAPAEVINRINNLISTYGQYYPDVIRGLQALPMGHRIDMGLTLSALHADKPWVTSFITAMRTKPSELNLEGRDIAEVKQRTLSNTSLNSMRSALLSSNPELVSYANELSDSVQKYSEYLVSTGRAGDPAEAVEQAVSHLIDSEFSFSESNDHTYAIRLSHDRGRYDGRQVSNIQDAFEFAQDNGLRGWTSDEKMLDNVDTSRFGLPEELTPENRRILVESMIKRQAFWATNPSNDGLTLMVPTIDGGSMPLTLKDGSPITYTFEDALKYYDSYVAPSKYGGVPMPVGTVGEFVGY
jgi:hypothetical protein